MQEGHGGQEVRLGDLGVALEGLGEAAQGGLGLLRGLDGHGHHVAWARAAAAADGQARRRAPRPISLT